jgi:hypothetical protein
MAIADVDRRYRAYPYFTEGTTRGSRHDETLLPYLVLIRRLVKFGESFLCVTEIYTCSFYTIENYDFPRMPLVLFFSPLVAIAVRYYAGSP